MAKKEKSFVETIEAISPADYRMPAEWELHAATWLAWPHQRGDWPQKFKPIPWVFAEIVRLLHTGERVRILVEDSHSEKRARKMLERSSVDLGQIDFFRVPTDRSWTRDFLPLFVKNPQGHIAATSWKFNGWAKYDNYRHDAAAYKPLAGKCDWTVFKPKVKLGDHFRRVVLEGGAIDVNGQGTLLATEECLLSEIQARNPGLKKAELENLLSQYLGIKKILWLGEGIVGDDTHGHIDDLVRFVGPRTVVVASEIDASDENYDRLRDAWRRLEKMSNERNEALELVALPMPEKVVFHGKRLPASYANFYVGNQVVLVPTFNDPKDRVALDTLARCFPTRKVVPIYARDLVWGLGTLHCMTQQEPA